MIVQVGSRCGGSWKVGDRVGVLNFKNACGQCVGCSLSQRRYEKLDPRFCDRRETAGFQHDGAFAQYLAADPETTVLLPASLSFEQAAPLMCAGVGPRIYTRLSSLPNMCLEQVLTSGLNRLQYGELWRRQLRIWNPPLPSP